eukprot:2865031-Rhodomonas_salina.1
MPALQPRKDLAIAKHRWRCSAASTRLLLGILPSVAACHSWRYIPSKALRFIAEMYLNIASEWELWPALAWAMVDQCSRQPRSSRPLVPPSQHAAGSRHRLDRRTELAPHLEQSKRCRGLEEHCEVPLGQRSPPPSLERDDAVAAAKRPTPVEELVPQHPTVHTRSQSAPQRLGVLQLSRVAHRECPPAQRVELHAASHRSLEPSSHVALLSGRLCVLKP